MFFKGQDLANTPPVQLSEFPSQHYAIGVDVGGTHTDAVLLSLPDRRVITTFKLQTTENVGIGITAAVFNLFQKTTIQHTQIRQVMIGTTQLLNALLEHRVERVGIIRLASPATTAIPPLTGWPTALADKIAGFVKIASGGYEYNGDKISPLNRRELEAIAKEAKEKGITHLAITGVYAHINPKQEILAAEILQSVCPDFVISLSHENTGELLERENATILDAALCKTYESICTSLHDILDVCNLSEASLFLSQSDGTLSPISRKRQNRFAHVRPILMLNSGAINSLRGAGCLIESDTNITHCLIADVGGTSTDVGLLSDKQITERNSLFKIANVSLKLPHALVNSIGLGGGSRIIVDGERVELGESVANRLRSESLCFGGNVLTATDIAVRLGRISPEQLNIKSTALEKLNAVAEKIITSANLLLHQRFAKFITAVWCSTEKKPETLVIVGGGAMLFDHTLLSQLFRDIQLKITIPAHHNSANALGAATAEIGATHIAIYDYGTVPRPIALEIAGGEARQKAVAKGADKDSLVVRTLEETAIQYVPGLPMQVRVTVTGTIRVGSPTTRPRAASIEEPRLRDSNPTLSKIAEGDLVDTETNSQDCEIPSSSMAKTTVTEIISDTLTQLPPLTEEQIDALALGHAFLGSGGGGDTRLAALMVKQIIKSEKILKLLPLAKLPDNATVICFGLMGSPSVVEEKLPSLAELVRPIIEAEKTLGKKIDAIVIGEGGGTNGLLPYVVGAALGLPIVDADTMGRALPGINMVTPIIYNAITHHMVCLANANQSTVIEAESAKALENKMRDKIGPMGGAAYGALMPMDGKTAKRVCVANTASVALNIGRQLISSRRLKQDPLVSLNLILKESGYGDASEIFTGRISDLRKIEHDGFFVGGIVVTGGEQTIEVIFQNESLLARKELVGGGYETLAEVPDLIVAVDVETFIPISTPQFAHGQRIRVLKLEAPKLLKTPEALAVLGPKACGLDRLIELFSQNMSPPRKEPKSRADSWVPAELKL